MTLAPARYDWFGQACGHTKRAGAAAVPATVSGENGTSSSTSIAEKSAVVMMPSVKARVTIVWTVVPIDDHSCP